MKTYLDCVPCIIKQAVRAPRRFTDDPAVVERILRKTMLAIAESDLSRTPPEISGLLNHIMNRELGSSDPYLKDKQRFNMLASALLPSLRKKVESAADPFEAAVRFAVAANFVDFGAPAGRTDGSLEELFAQALSQPIKGDGVDAVIRLRELTEKADSILYIADNAGEIVIDRLLVEQLPRGKVTVAVRAGPAINDALLEDASVAGLDEVAQVVTNGVDLPGTPLEVCPPDFVERFRSADLIISKGQGNLETLFKEPDTMYFLLVAKCRTVAQHFSCEVGDFVVAENNSAMEGLL
ncbi:MAG: DUF89 family protein [Deltaproteobacteria bacterium]|nr:DUF89 family protein [Deltaproteobacteria bacterium]